MNFKGVLKKYGITQIELAKKLGINRVSVSRLFSDNNDMRASTIEKVAKAIGCKAGEFFDDYAIDEQKIGNLSAIVEYQGDFYKASTIDELCNIVMNIKNKIKKNGDIISQEG